MGPYAAGQIKAAATLGMSPQTFERASHWADGLGLAALAAYPAYHLYQDFKHDRPKGEHALELAGLGLLASPHLMRRFVR